MNAFDKIVQRLVEDLSDERFFDFFVNYEKLPEQERARSLSEISRGFELGKYGPTVSEKVFNKRVKKLELAGVIVLKREPNGAKTPHLTSRYHEIKKQIDGVQSGR